MDFLLERRKLWKQYKSCLSLNPTGKLPGIIGQESFLDFMKEKFGSRAVFKFFGLFCPLDNDSGMEMVWEEFAAKYCCDLEWAKTESFCTSIPNPNDWDKCVKDKPKTFDVPDYGTVTLTKDHKFTSTGPKYKSGTWECNDDKLVLKGDNLIVPPPPPPTSCPTTTAKASDIV